MQLTQNQSWTNTIKRWNMPKSRNSRKEMEDKKNTEKYMVFSEKE